MDSRLRIGEVVERSGVPATTLRYYEDLGLLSSRARVGGRRHYDDSVLTRLQVIALCKAAGFRLDEIKMLLVDDAPGRPTSRALAAAKLADIDAQIATLHQARSIIEQGMSCTCPSLDACSCGVRPSPASEVIPHHG